MPAQLALSWSAAEDGIRRSADHAEAVEPGWAGRAYALLREYADSCWGDEFTRHDFTSEDFRKFLADIDFPVAVPKALGAVFKKAARNRVIERAGFAPSKDRHCSPTILWRKAG